MEEYIMWKAILKNNTQATEISHKWSDIKKDIETLSYDYNGVEVNLPALNGKIKEYLQFKSASASLSGGAIDVESQTVGVILKDGTKISVKFSMKEKKINVVVE